MARRSRGSTAKTVTPVTRATRSRTRLQAAEALAAELNASRESCEPSRSSNTSSRASMIDESSCQMQCEESALPNESIICSSASPEINAENEDISLEVPIENSPPATNYEEQSLDDESLSILRKEVKDILDVTINEVVKGQRILNIDPATTSVQSNVRVRGVYHTKGFLDAKISLFQEYLEKYAPDELSLSVDSSEAVCESSEELIVCSTQESFAAQQESKDSSLSLFPNSNTEISFLSKEEHSIERSGTVSDSKIIETVAFQSVSEDNKESIPIERSGFATSQSTDPLPNNVSSTQSLLKVKMESPEDDSEASEILHFQCSSETNNLPENSLISSSSILQICSSTTDQDSVPQILKSDLPNEYSEIKSECPDSPVDEQKSPPSLNIKLVQENLLSEVSTIENQHNSDPEQILQDIVSDDITILNVPTLVLDENAEGCFPKMESQEDNEMAELTEASSNDKEIEVGKDVETNEKPEINMEIVEEVDKNDADLTSSERATEQDDMVPVKTTNPVESSAPNQSTITANNVAIDSPNNLSWEITGTQEMDMDVSDDSRGVSVEPIINVNQSRTVPVDILPVPSAPEISRPPQPSLSHDVPPPPPSQDSYADEFYFPPPPSMPPNMDLSQFYMSLHAGDFGVEYTQQLTQYITESVHKWYQIHQYYTFNRVSLPRIERYKEFMDHYDAFQRVQYSAVLRPNAEAQKLSEEKSRSRIQGVLKSLVRDKKKKESAAEKNEESTPLFDEQVEKNVIELKKPELEIVPPVMNKSADVVEVSSSNEIFKKLLPPPQVLHYPTIACEKEPSSSTIPPDPDSSYKTDQNKITPPENPESIPSSSNVLPAQTKKHDKSRSRSPKRRRSYSRSRSRSRTRSRSRSRYRSKSRSRSRSRSYARSRSRSFSRSRTPHSRSRSRSRRRGRSRSRSRSQRRYRSRSPRGYRQRSPKRWNRGYRSFRNSRGGGYRSRSPWSDRRSHYKGYTSYNDRFKKRNYSRSPIREPNAPPEVQTYVEPPVEPVVEVQACKEVEVVKEDVVIQEPPFPKFEEIETLIYMDEKVSKNGKKRRLETDLDCDCRKNSLDCSDQRCINREMMFECSSKCGPQCKNRRFALRQYASVKPFYTGPNKGWGVRAMEKIPKGAFIIEYIGEVVTNEEFASRQKRYAKDPNHTHHYIFELGQKLIDATVKGNSSRFINHSCDPNAICLKWAVPKTPRDVSRIGFFAKNDIAIGDEITFDYQFCNYGRTAQSCHCGSTNCKGVIGKKPDLDDFDDDEVYDEDSEEFDDVDEQEEDKELLRIEKEEQLEAKAIFYLNTIHSEGYDGRKQLAKNAARFVKYLANVLTTENRIRMQSLIERADSEFYQCMKRNNMFNILLQWVSTSGWERHDLDLKIGVLRMIEEKDKDNFIEKAVGWNQENFPILCDLAKGVLPDDIACVDTLEQVVEKVCGDDPEAEGDGNLASYTGVVFNEMTEIATRLAGDENIRKGVETTGLKVFKIPKKIREKIVEHKEPLTEKSDFNKDRNDYRSNFRAGFSTFNGKRDFERGLKRRYDDRYRRDDDKGANRDSHFGRHDFKRTRRSRFDQSPVHSPQSFALNAESSVPIDSSASMSIDSTVSPAKATLKVFPLTPHPSTHPSSFESYHQNMAMWQSYMSMGGYPIPYPGMNPVSQKTNLSDSDKKIGYYMSMRLEQLKHFRTSYEMEIRYLDVAMKKKEAEAALAKAHQEAAAAAAAAVALANESTKKEADSVPSVKAAAATATAPPPPPERKRSNYARALDVEGTVYYYHKDTRATCWELPEGECCDENDAVPYTQTQQPDSSMKEEEEPKCQMDIATRAMEIFSSPPGGSEVKSEEVSQTTGSVEILSDLPEDEKQKRIRVFKLTVEREVKPIIDSFLKGIPSADANRRLWLIKQVAKEMYKRESSKPDSDLKFNDIIRKKVHNYTKAFMHRKCSDGGKDLWKGFEVFA